MKKIVIIAGLVSTAFLTSCDFLDKEPMDAISKEQFFTTANATALEQYCNGLYPGLILGYGSPKSYDWGMLGTDFTSDDVLPWERNTTSFGLATVPSSASGTEWNWTNIRTCNDFLENYHLSPAPEVAKKKWAGVIYFFKTLDYFNKVKTYGDVPWFSKVMNPGDEEMYKARDSRTLVMDSMLMCINRAIEWMPKKTDVTQVSKDAALALKARMCLFEGTWRKYHNIEGADKFLKEAYDAACEVMKPEYGYKLFTGSSKSMAYHELFCQADQSTNPEVILSKAYDPAIDKGNNLTRQIYVGETPLGMSKNCADSYLCATTGKPISICGCEGHTHHTTLIAELKNRDPRMLQTTATTDTSDPEHCYYNKEGKAPNIGSEISTGNPSRCSTGYPIVKFYNEAEYSSSHYTGTEDAPVFRLGEIMLIRAEAAAELGTITQTDLDETINKLRERVGFSTKLTVNVTFDDPVIAKDYPNVTGQYAKLIREIRRERRIEMFGEGVRYDDIRRWACKNLLTAPRLGIIIEGAGYTADEIKTLKEKVGVNGEGALTIYEKRYAGQSPTPVFEDPKNYLSPIPTDEIGKAPNIEQNEGW